MVEERFYTPGELARILNVSTRKVQRWLKDGKIAHYKLDERTMRIPQSVVDKLLAKSLEARTRRVNVT